MHAAGIWPRWKAFVLDYLWILLYLFFVFLLTLFIVPELQSFFQKSLATAQWTGFLLVTMPVSLYFAIFDSRHFGGSFGKKKMNIQVVGRNGKGIDIMRSIFRVALKFAPWELSHFLVYRLVQIGEGSVPMPLALLGGGIYGLMILYIATALWSKEKRTLYDLLSGTKVIKRVNLRTRTERL